MRRSGGTRHQHANKVQWATKVMIPASMYFLWKQWSWLLWPTVGTVRLPHPGKSCWMILTEDMVKIFELGYRLQMTNSEIQNSSLYLLAQLVIHIYKKTQHALMQLKIVAVPKESITHNRASWRIKFVFTKWPEPLYWQFAHPHWFAHFTVKNDVCKHFYT